MYDFSCIFVECTLGLEDEAFAGGTPEAAAKYEKNSERLTEHLGV